jgi:hypothetical protein
MNNRFHFKAFCGGNKRSNDDESHFETTKVILTINDKNIIVDHSGKTRPINTNKNNTIAELCMACLVETNSPQEQDYVSLSRQHF